MIDLNKFQTRDYYIDLEENDVYVIKNKWTGIVEYCNNNLPHVIDNLMSLQDELEEIVKVFEGYSDDSET